MFRFVCLNHSEDWTPYQDATLMRGVEPAMLHGQRPDEAWLALDARGVPLARASLWWRGAPTLPNERLGVVGHYAAMDGTGGVSLLCHLVERLRQQGCTLAAGPMDGNTWRRYRFITERGREPLFFLEPDNPDDYPQHFRDAGFDVFANYYSSLNADLAAEDDRVAGARERLSAAGVTLRALRLEEFDRELGRIYELSIAAFVDNFLYTPITREEFLSQYQKAKPLLVPELVRIAEIGDEVVGYGFGLPDAAQAQRGQAIDTFIVKTVAVLPGRRQGGLGAWLVADMQACARAHGFRRAIHALMHESNRSRNISRHTAGIMRRYSLFVRRLLREGQ